MIGFLGEYEVTVDSKGRFLLPAKFKEQLPAEESSQFVINRGLEACLSLYPIKIWEPLFEKVNKLNDFDTKVRQFKRYFLNGATMMELDSAGRLLVPQSLREYAGLEKDIVLVSMGKRIEIWDVNKYKKELFESYSQEEFKNVASEVMKDE
ncbi:MAG: division/cell wall cluster transcriptional repressor MraZ [Bacteroidetes bacterium]|nr:division/cell wall cluster transcriptional repressor MraZ [Bacteroidota bacterium]MBS1973844.1 division/cell wall cluster transcriptional repressor MraZ [Bacteroidota bacterium]